MAAKVLPRLTLSIHSLPADNKLWLAIMLGLLCVVGDNFVAASREHKLLQVFWDNVTHASVAGVAMLIVVLEFANRLPVIEERLLVLTACLVGAFIDVDHFLEAHSWHLDDATRLNHRPFMHCSNLLLIVCGIFIAASILRSFRINMFLMMMILAIATHHTRDAARRGYWIRPFGNTAPLPYALYVAITVALPFAAIAVLNMTRFDSNWSVIRTEFRAGILNV